MSCGRVTFSGSNCRIPETRVLGKASTIRVLALVATLCGQVCPISHAEDCNGNGVSDEVDIRTGASEDCNQNMVPDECESMPLRFAEVPHLPSAGVPLAVTTGDFNSDLSK